MINLIKLTGNKTKVVSPCILKGISLRDSPTTGSIEILAKTSITRKTEVIDTEVLRSNKLIGTQSWITIPAIEGVSEESIILFKDRDTFVNADLIMKWDIALPNSNTYSWVLYQFNPETRDETKIGYLASEQLGGTIPKDLLPGVYSLVIVAGGKTTATKSVGMITVLDNHYYVREFVSSKTEDKVDFTDTLHSGEFDISASSTLPNVPEVLLTENTIIECDDIVSESGNTKVTSKEVFLIVESL